MKKRRLSDLYVVGKELQLDDGSGEEPVVVFLRKLNPVEQETAVRNANAARARLLAISKSPESDEYQSLISQARDLDRENQIDFLIGGPLQKVKAAAEAELAAEEEWSTDGYLQGLSDAWLEGLNEEYAVNQEHAEAAKVFAELQRFAKVVDEIVDEERERLVAGYEHMSEDEIVDLVAKELLTLSSDTHWVREFRKNELFFAVREQDKKTRYFQSREELDELSQETLFALSDAYRQLAVEPVEGKDSRRTGDSSPSSEPLDQEETIPSSGQKVLVR